MILLNSLKNYVVPQDFENDDPTEKIKKALRKLTLKLTGWEGQEKAKSISSDLLTSFLHVDQLESKELDPDPAVAWSLVIFNFVRRTMLSFLLVQVYES